MIIYNKFMKGLNISMAKTAKKALRPGRKKEVLACYLLLLLPLIGFFVFNLYPLAWQIQKAFLRYNGVASHTKYVGLGNFINIFTENKNFWRSYLVTFQFALIKVPIELTIAFILASILSKSFIKARSFFRAVYYMPVLLSAVIIGVIYSNMFGYFGVVNSILQKLHIISEPIDFFRDKWTTMATLIGTHVWNNVGTNVLYFLAALANIPKDCYEAAYLDGASGFTMTRKITLPLMGPVLSTILLLSFLGTLGVGEFIYVTSNGAPAGSTTTVQMYMLNYLPGFSTGTIEIGYASALSFVISIISIIASFSFRKLSTWLTTRA